MVNGVRWPIGPLSPFPTQSSASSFSSLSAASWKHMVQPHSRSVTMETQRSPCIQATGGAHSCGVGVECLFVILYRILLEWNIVTAQMLLHCICTEHISHMALGWCSYIMFFLPLSVFLNVFSAVCSTGDVPVKLTAARGALGITVWSLYWGIIDSFLDQLIICSHIFAVICYIYNSIMIFFFFWLCCISLPRCRQWSWKQWVKTVWSGVVSSVSSCTGGLTAVP